MFHVQKPVDRWLEAVKILPSGSFIKVTAVQWASEIKLANESVTTMLRYVNDKIQNVSQADTDEIRMARARDWFNRFIDGTFLNGETVGIPHWKAVDIIGFWNEYFAESQTPEEKALWWRQERIAADVWHHEYRNGPNAAKLRHIRLAICAAPVGNDIPWQSAWTAHEYDCILDYHGYDKFLSLKKRDPLSWRYHCGRWATMDELFRRVGYSVDILLGEGGPYGGVIDGWRSHKVLGGDLDAYVEAVRVFIREIKDTDAYKTGRFKGFSLFTTGGGSTWELYETRTDELIAIAKMISEEGWNPGGGIPPSTLLPMEQVGASLLRVRVVPNGEIVGLLARGTVLRPTARIIVDGDVWVEWGNMGWSAERYGGYIYLVPVKDY